MGTRVSPSSDFHGFSFQNNETVHNLTQGTQIATTSPHADRCIIVSHPLPSVHEDEASRAVRAFRLPFAEARLAEKRRLERGEREIKRYISHEEP